MNIGEKVLSKIETLLTEIDRPQPKYFRKHSRIQSKQNMSEQQNVFMKLHNISKIKKHCQTQRLKKQEDEEQRQLSPFKVSNKHSQFLMSLKQTKPIYERVGQILQQRKDKMEKLRELYPAKKTQEEEQQQAVRQIEQRKKNQRKYTKKQLQMKLLEMEDRQRRRLAKISNNKVAAFEQYAKQYRCKPYLTKSSEKYWMETKIKLQLSSSVFQRFQQYDVKRMRHLQETKAKINKQLTPFIPQISENSRILAKSRSRSRAKLHEPSDKNMGRSLSCKCFQKRTLRRQNTSTALQTSRINDGGE